MCDYFGMKMRHLKKFSTTRFANSVRSVFDTLIEDFKAVVKCLEDIISENSSSEGRQRANDAKILLNKILSKSFVIKLSGVSDIYEQFGHIANICQIVDLLPFERSDAIFQQTERFRIMIGCLFDH